MIKQFQLYRIITLLMIALGVTNTVAAQNLDIDLLKKINPVNPNSDYWKITSSSAYWVPATGMLTTFLIGSINHDKTQRQKAYNALISIGASTIVCEIFKVSINRTRPAYAYPLDISEGSSKGIEGYSFPSGHACLAFNYATILTLEYKKWYVSVPAYLWAGSVAYSRMYLGKHYPSDVLAGAALATVSGWLTYKLNKRLFRKKL